MLIAKKREFGGAKRGVTSHQNSPLNYNIFAVYQRHGGTSTGYVLGYEKAD